MACYNIFSMCVVNRHLCAISVAFHPLSPDHRFRFCTHAGVFGFVMSFAELPCRIHLLYIVAAAICHKSFHLPPALYVMLSTLFLLLFYFRYLPFAARTFTHSFNFMLHNNAAFNATLYWCVELLLTFKVVYVFCVIAHAQCRSR